MDPHAVFKQLDRTIEIRTKRLILKRLSPNDADALYQIAKDPCVSRYLLWDPHTSLRYTRLYLKNLMNLYRNHTYFEWGVYRKDDDALIGTCGITAFQFPHATAEIGYSFGVEYWGYGYATEAVRATVRYAFEKLSVKRVEACYALQNAASARVLEKSGLTYVGEGEHMIIKGNDERVGYYAMTCEEFSALQTSAHKHNNALIPS